MVVSLGSKLLSSHQN